MNSLNLAFRNIFRNKRRSFFTLMSIVIGIAGLVVFQGFVRNQMVQFRASVVQGGIGHLQVAASPDYYLKGEYNPFDYILPDSEKLISTLRKVEYVKSVIPALGFTGLAASSEKTISLLFKAYPVADPLFANRERATEAQLKEARQRPLLIASLSTGNQLSADVPNGVVVGERAAKILNVKLGDVITVLGMVSGGGMNGTDMKIVGIYKGAVTAEKYFAYISYDFAKSFIGVEGPSTLLLTLDNIDNTNKVAGLVKEIKDPNTSTLATRKWTELAVYYRQVNTMYTTFLTVIRAILLLVILFVIVNTQTMSVMERMREIGTLRALGTSRIQVVLTFIFEGGLLGAIGSIFGVLLGFILSWIFNLMGGVPMVYDGEMVRNYFTPDIMSMLPNIWPVILFALIASAGPARKAGKLQIADTLRFI